MKKSFLYGVLLLMSLLFSSCDKETYVYPPVKLDFLTAQSKNDGSLQTVVTDKGELLSVVEDRSYTKIAANSTQRVVANYEQLIDGSARIYALLTQVIAVVPEPEESKVFESGVKTTPAEVQSIWMGLDYLNIVLLVKQTGAHRFHFVEKENRVDEKGNRVVTLLLYHDSDDSLAYTRRAYLSIPLKQYANEMREKVIINFNYFDTNGMLNDEFTFEYIPTYN